MAKFCGKCGSKLDDETGLCPRCDNSEEMSQENIELHESNGGPKKTKQHKAWLRVFVVTLVLIVGIGTGAILWVQFGDTQIAKELATSNSELSVISGESISESIGSPEEAVSVLAEMGPELGYQNALSEMIPLYYQNVMDTKIFRLQQNYEGVPVYGRTISLLTDGEGHVLMVSGNCEDVQVESISNVPVCSYQDVTKAVENNFSQASKLEFLNDSSDTFALCLYPENNELRYNYVVPVSVCGNQGGIYEILVDAETSKVTKINETINEVTGYRASDEERKQSFEITEVDDSQYILLDPMRRILVYNLGGESFIEDIEVKDGWFGDTSSWEHYNYDKGKVVESDNIIFGDNEQEKESCAEEGAQWLIYAEKVYDFFSEIGFQSEGTIVLYYQDSYDNGNNALGGYHKDYKLGLISMGQNIEETEAIDVIAHEFTHFVSRALVAWNGDNATASVNEAVSDIFGEIIEADILCTAPDWEMYIYRNVASPQDDCLVTLQQYLENPKIDCHLSSTIISHAAYLMWNGIDGNETKKIDTKTLSYLWYLSMMIFPSDVDFETCGFVVESVAALLNSRDIISDAQLSCVDEAFTNVGITGRIDISEYAEKLGRVKADILPTEHLSPENAITAYAEALDKLSGNSISITKEGSFSADFVNFSELQFTQKMDIQQFGQPTMTASGHYTSTGGSGGSTSEMDYNFTYDSQGMHIPDYEQPVTGELVTLELPPLECVHSYSETEGDGDGKTYLVTYDGETLTQENCGIFSSVLDSSFRIYWSPSEEYADEDGIQEAEVLFSIDNEGNLVSIEVSYQMYAGIQGIAPVEGTTMFTFGSVTGDSISSLLEKIDTDLVLKSLANIGTGDSQIVYTDQSTTEDWQRFASTWMATALWAYQDDNDEDPTPIREEDFISADESRAYFSQDALNAPIQLFGGDPEEVLDALCSYSPYDDYEGDQIRMERDRLVWILPGRGYAVIRNLQLRDITENTDNVQITFGYELEDVGGWISNYEGTATLVECNNSLGYKIESYQQRVVDDEQEISQPTKSLSYQMHTDSFEFPLSDGRLYYTNELTYPYFQGTFDVVDAINQHYSDIVDGYRSNDTNYDAIYQEALQWNQHVDEGMPYYDDLETEVTLFDINGAVAIKETYTMWSGGAHPYHEVKGINFDVTSGQMLSYEDILQGTSEQVDALLRKYFIEAVPWHQGANGETMSMEEILEYAGYTLTENGLCFYYNVGDSVERQEIIIPYTSSDSYLISAEELLSSSSSN